MNPRAPAAATAAPDAIRVLLIEDDEDDYVLTRALLDEIGDTPFELDWRSTPDAAREALRRHEHDVCLLDYRLGEYNGIELLAEAQAAGYDVPIIVLTGQGNRDIDVEAMRAGAAYYLAKAGIDAPALERTIRYALELRRAEQRARDSEARVRAILDHAVDGIVTIDERGTIESFNPAATRLFGYAPEEAIGENVRILMPEPQRSSHDDFLRHYRETGVARIIGTGREMIARRKDGSPVPIELAVSEMVLHGQRKFIGSVRDITERHAAAETVRRLNADLERRVAQRTAELATVNGELEAFSYSVSHDLRAPLRAIDGFAQALADDFGGLLPEQGRHYVERVRAGACRMGELIDDLLQLARVTRSDLRRRPVDLSALAHEIAAELRAKEPARAVEWSIQPGLVADGDATLLRLALENLLGNAWKYTSRRPQAHIAFAAELRDGACAYHVRDDGAGFDMAYVDRLFRPFQRLHGPTEFDGTGIGLATVQRIVHRHGGRVWAEGAVDQGATIYFTL